MIKILTFTEFLNEGKFKGKEIVEDNYLHDVIQYILDNSKIKIGNKGDETVPINLSAEIDKNDPKKTIKSQLVELQNEIKDGINAKNFYKYCVKFNKCIKPVVDSRNQSVTWSKICRNEFSQQNSGSEFEDVVVAEFDKYKKDIAGVLNINVDELKNAKIEHTGTKNKKRGFGIDEDGPKVHFSDGETVADVTVTYGNPPQKLYLSLKSGDKTTFVNTGINNGRFFSISAFETEEPFGKEGQEFLKFMDIDEKMFRKSFTSYKENIPDEEKNRIIQEFIDNYGKEKITITKSKGGFIVNIKEPNIENLEKLTKYAKSTIGNGYILMHENPSRSGNVEYYDFRKQEAVDKLFEGGIISVVNKYYFNGSGKRNTVCVEYEHIKMFFTFRNKDKGIYPRSLTVDYEIKNK